MALPCSNLQPDPGCGGTVGRSKNDPSRAMSILLLSQTVILWHKTSNKTQKTKRKNLVRNNLKGKSYEIKTQRTSMGKSFKKKKIPYYLIRVTGGSTIPPNENQNKNLEAKR